MRLTAAFFVLFAACETSTAPPPADAALRDVPPSQPDVDVCRDAAVAALAGVTLDFRWWEGEAAPAPAPIGTLARWDSACGSLVAMAPWVNVAGAAVGFATDGLPTGLHESVVALRRGAETLAEAPVRLRVIRRAPAGATRRVLVIGVDGARPDALEAADTPWIDFLRRHGAYTAQARTQLDGPTKSAPGWLSVFTGVSPGRHRVTANGMYADRDRTQRTFVARAFDAGRRAIVSSAWVEITSDIVEPDVAAQRNFAVDPLATVWLAERLRSEDADVFFQHLDQVDQNGHITGFSATNPAYLAALGRVDGHVGTLLDAVLARPAVTREDWLFVMTTDHGGSGVDHGAMDAANQTIWFLTAGAAVAPGELPAMATSHMDVAPTVLRWINVAVDPAWRVEGVARGLP